MAHSKPISLWPCNRKVYVRGPAANHSKASIKARLVQRKVCFISDAGNCWGWWWTSVQGPTLPTPWQEEGESFYRQSWSWGRLYAETAQSSLTGIFKLVISGLISIIFVVFSSVQLLSRVRLFETHGRQHTRLSCPSPTPRACSYSCPLKRWYHPKHPWVVLGTVNLLFPFLSSQFSELWVLKSWVQCGHHVVTAPPGVLYL